MRILLLVALLGVISPLYAQHLQIKSLQSVNCPFSQVSDVEYYKDSLLWIATDQGIVQLTTDGENKAEASCKYITHYPSFILKSENANIWFLALVEGKYKIGYISKFHKQIFELPINPSAVISSMEIAPSRLWISTEKAGIYEFQKDNMRQLGHYTKEKRNIGTNYIFELLQDDKGNVWGATNIGLFVLKANSNKWRPILQNEISFASALTLKNKEMWCASRNDLWKVTLSNEFEKHKLDYRLTEKPIQQLTVDKQGYIWALSNTLGRYDNEASKWICLGEEEGFTSTHGYCINVQKPNQVLIGTEGKGLFILDGCSEAEIISYLMEEHESLVATKRMNHLPSLKEYFDNRLTPKKNITDKIEDNSISYEGKILTQSDPIIYLTYKDDSFLPNDYQKVKKLKSFLNRYPNVSIRYVGHFPKLSDENQLEVAFLQQLVERRIATLQNVLTVNEDESVKIEGSSLCEINFNEISVQPNDIFNCSHFIEVIISRVD